ncbi:MAG: hypothetical protein GY720_02645 [bacterium]|nr:hypothetical protein [bacterium]
MNEWKAHALIFSGRPDPEWVVPADRITSLVEAWAGMSPTDVEPPRSSNLGYRGVVLVAPEGRSWFAFGGTVTLTEGDQTERRADEGSQWEFALVGSAPSGLLPPLA